MTIQVHRQGPQKSPTTTFILGLLRIICAGLGYPDGRRLPQIAVTLCEDSAIRAINCEWRSKDKATDVLSFSQVEGEQMPLPPGMAPAWGDVVISLETAERQALALGHSLHEEVTRLLVHGVLHLLGHDHVRGGKEARRMQKEEARILALVWAA